MYKNQYLCLSKLLSIIQILIKKRLTKLRKNMKLIIIKNIKWWY